MITKLHESRESLEQILSAFKEVSKTDKIWYKKIDRDISSLLLDVELSVKKLKIVINNLTVDDYVKNIVQGNERIALFGKRIHAQNLLIGITTQYNPIPPYIFLNISCEPLTFPHHQQKLAAHDGYFKKVENRTEKRNL